MAKLQTAPNNKKTDMIYCECCGEDYSATYRRCPFCDERPGRRIDDRGRLSPLRVAVLILTLVIILAAAFIVLSKVAPLLKPVDPPAVEAPGVEDPADPDTPAQPDTPDLPTPGVSDKTDPNAVPASAIVISRTDITLVHGETYSLAATVAPSNTTDTVVWSCDRPDLLEIAEDGSVTNKNTTGEKVVVNVTATAGAVSAQCVVRCNSGAFIPNDPVTPSTGEPITGSTPGKVTGAGGGLNVRSGPGSNYQKVASINNGTNVTILENAGNGWYKIDYGNGKTGYVSADYVVPTGSGSTSGGSSSGSSSTGSSSGSTTPSTPSAGQTISGKTKGTVSGAANGLNVRSGPGSNYEKVASIANGNTVTILENTGTGWYKIDYGNGKTGYASVDYIKAK